MSACESIAAQPIAAPLFANDADGPLATTVLLASHASLALQAELIDLIAERRLACVFQPIFDFEQGSVYGYEGLIRGPQDSPLATPAALFRMAAACGMLQTLDDACQEVVRQSFATSALPGHLFLNMIPSSLEAGRHTGLTHSDILDPRRIVIEITEIERVRDNQALREQIEFLRGHGFMFGIDDLGEGFATFRMWSELRPDYVKIDQHFVRGLTADRLKQEFVRSILRIGESAGCLVIAEGIETAEEFDTLRALGIRYGQGYFLGLPSETPLREPDANLQARLAAPPRNASADRKAGTTQELTHQTALALTLALTPIDPDTHNDTIAQMFNDNETLSLIPVVQNGIPLGLIERYTFASNYVRPYARELFGRKPCRMYMQSGIPTFAHDEPLLNLLNGTGTLPGNQLPHGLFVTRAGRYHGVVPGRDLVAMITGMQLETARYANPLTMLPGNVTINKRIEEWLGAGLGFAAVYADLDDFKPFNDYFGYKKGDDLIQTLGRLLLDYADASQDFVGHIGGDDFLLLFRSVDWAMRCEHILAAFPDRLATCLPALVIEEGHYIAEDRQGAAVTYRLPTLSLGAVFITPEQFATALHVSSAAAEAKKQSKRIPGNSLFIERRG